MEKYGKGFLKKWLKIWQFIKYVRRDKEIRLTLDLSI
jgi:hypothetical protein